MSEAKPQYLQYRIVGVSSFLEEYRPVKICNSSPFGDGWITAPNPAYPEFVVLDFQRVVSVNKISIISHQTKVPKKITIEMAHNAQSWNRAKFSYLGTTEFTDNKVSGYKTRERRTAVVPNVQLRFLKIIIHGTHPNKYNKDNQIGIISVNVSGDEIENEVDNEITSLEEQKQMALNREDYGRAAEIKKHIDSIRRNKDRIDELNREKEQAVTNEDYERAHQIKKEILRLTGAYQSPPNQYKRNYNHLIQDSRMSSNYVQSDVKSMADNSHIPDDDDSIYPNQSLIDQSYRKDVQPDVIRNKLNYNDAQYRRSPPIHNEARFNESREILPRRGNPQIFEDDDAGDIEPDEIPEELRQKISDMLDYCDEYSVKKFFDKNISNKISGTVELSKQISSITQAKIKEKLFSQFIQFLHIRLREPYQQVIWASVVEIMRLSDYANISTHMIRANVEQMIPLIGKNIGSVNKRLNTACSNFMKYYAKKVGPSHVLHELFNIQPKASANIILEKLLILEEIVKECFDDYYNEFDTGEIASFAIKYLEYQTDKVREQALTVLKALSRKMYDAGLQFDIKKKLISEGFNQKKIEKILQDLQLR